MELLFLVFFKEVVLSKNEEILSYRKNLLASKN